jgi:hypothetical protein
MQALFGCSQTWLSYTPYLLARHPKAGGRDSAEQQLLRECAKRGLPQPELASLPDPGLSYQVHRGPRKGPPGPPAWYQLSFPQLSPPRRRSPGRLSFLCY